jgi:hypothetical protein
VGQDYIVVGQKFLELLPKLLRFIVSQLQRTLAEQSPSSIQIRLKLWKVDAMNLLEYGIPNLEFHLRPTAAKGKQRETVSFECGCKIEDCQLAPAQGRIGKTRCKYESSLFTHFLQPWR